MDGGTTRWERRGRDGRLTIRDAALVMGISEGAVRKRVSRGTLDHTRGTDGRIFVLLPDGVDEGSPVSNPLISEMRDRIGFLENELQRKDAILMNMTDAMKAITAPTPPERRGSPPEPAQPRPGTDTPADGRSEPRAWWRRWFGF